MKYLLTAMAAIVLCGCQSDRQYAGRPGDESYTEDETRDRDRRIESRAGDNVHDIGRQSSPSGPQSFGNGSLNF